MKKSQKKSPEGENLSLVTMQSAQNYQLYLVLSTALTTSLVPNGAPVSIRGPLRLSCSELITEIGLILQSKPRKHSYLADLSMDTASPSGTRVHLR